MFLNKEHYATLLCTPTHLKVLVVGHLVPVGVVRSLEEVREVRMLDRGRFEVVLGRGIDVRGGLSSERLFFYPQGG
ncbi:MAG: formate dehydrogenase accessory sulfurtransferase FdhD [Candidatus Bathyarchaeia archaeon]